MSQENTNINHEQEILQSRIPRPTVCINSIIYVGHRIEVRGAITYIQRGRDIERQLFTVNEQLPQPIIDELLPTHEAIHEANQALDNAQPGAHVQEVIVPVQLNPEEAEQDLTELTRIIDDHGWHSNRVPGALTSAEPALSQIPASIVRIIDQVGNSNRVPGALTASESGEATEPALSQIPASIVRYEDIIDQVIHSNRVPDADIVEPESPLSRPVALSNIRSRSDGTTNIFGVMQPAGVRMMYSLLRGRGGPAEPAVPVPEQKVDVVAYDEEKSRHIEACVGCLENYPNFANNPCGHIAFCGTCVLRVTDKRCPVCKVPVDKYLQVFF
jgi:hypothetical protein